MCDLRRTLNATLMVAVDNEAGWLSHVTSVVNFSHPLPGTAPDLQRLDCGSKWQQLQVRGPGEHFRSAPGMHHVFADGKKQLNS